MMPWETDASSSRKGLAFMLPQIYAWLPVPKGQQLLDQLRVFTVQEFLR
jgi:hypothetical protein